MEQKRLFIAIAISVAILLGFQLLLPHAPRPTPAQTAEQTAAAPQTAERAPPTNTVGASPQDAGAAPAPAPANAGRVKIYAPSVEGSIDLAGARFDDLVLRDYRETIQPDS